MSERDGIAELERGQARQDRIWWIQRLGWSAMAAVLLLGALGLFGDGPLAMRRASTPNGEFRVDYDGFQRSDASTLYRVRLAAPDMGGIVLICPDKRFLETWRLRHTEPTFIRAVEGDDGLCWEFAQNGHNGRTDFRIYVQPRDPAVWADGVLRTSGGRSLRVGSVIWP